MTVAPIGNLLAAFEEQISRNNEQEQLQQSTASPTPEPIASEEDRAWDTTSSNMIMHKLSRRDRHRNRSFSPSKRLHQGLAESIRDKVKLFDEGQVTLVRKLSREFDYDPDQVEFDPAVSRTVFERRSSMGPETGAPSLEELRRTNSFDDSSMAWLHSRPPSGALLSEDDRDRKNSTFSHLQVSSPRPAGKQHVSRRASAGVLPSMHQQEGEKKKSPEKAKRKKKKRKDRNTTVSSALSSSDEGEMTPLMSSPKPERKKRVADTTKSPTKSPTKSKSHKKASHGKKSSSSKSSSSASSTSGFPSAPNLERPSPSSSGSIRHHHPHHRRRGRKKDKKHSHHKSSTSGSSHGHKKKSSSVAAKCAAKQSKWEFVLRQHNHAQAVMLGGLHRSLSMTSVQQKKPVTLQRRMARRASTGRLLTCHGENKINPNGNENHLWELMATHAVQMKSQEDVQHHHHQQQQPKKSTTAEDTTTSTTGHLDEDNAIVVQEASDGGARPVPRRRMVRRHSTGSVSTRSNESEEQLVDFWHAYETDDSSSETSSTASVVYPPRYTRRRAVRFDLNVTVWVFTKEDTPVVCDLELPQSFVPSAASPTNDSAPRPPVRRTNSIERKESLPHSRDAAPAAPPRRHSFDSLDNEAFALHSSDDDDHHDNDNDDNSIDSWPRLGKQSRQSQERHQKKQKPRVRFAEKLEEVRYYEKDNIPEVVLPQVGIVFCAAATEHEEDHAPKAPRRYTDSNAGVLMFTGLQDDHAPRAPRRNNSSTALVTSIQDSIEGLRASEDKVREARESDLMPRYPTRRDSSRSINSDESTISLQDSDDEGTLEELSEEEEEGNELQQQQGNCTVSSLRPGCIRGESLQRVHSQGSYPRDDSVDSVSRPKSPPPHCLRPDTVRSDSIQSFSSNTGDSFASWSKTKNSGIHALRPTTIRGDSIQSIQSISSNASSIRSTTSGSITIQGMSSLSLRPSTVRGGSFSGFTDDASTASTECSSHRDVTRSLRPSGFRGDSFRDTAVDVSTSLRPSGFRGDSFRDSGAETSTGPTEIILEGSEEMQSPFTSKHKYNHTDNQTPLINLQQDIIWEGATGEFDAEDTTESYSEDIMASGIPQAELTQRFNLMIQQDALPGYAKRPSGFRGDSIREVGGDTMSADEASSNMKKPGLKKVFCKRRRRGVKSSKSNDETSSFARPNVFAKLGMKRGKLFRFTSS